MRKGIQLLLNFLATLLLGSHLRMVVVAGGAFVVLLDPGMSGGRIDEDDGVSWRGGQIHEWLAFGLDAGIGAVRKAGPLIEPGGECRDVRMQAILGGQGRHARVLIAVNVR